jgi:hypothetical protein
MAGVVQPQRGHRCVKSESDWMRAEYLIDQAIALTYRWAGYALLNWADDAALMALMFC